MSVWKQSYRVPFYLFCIIIGHGYRPIWAPGDIILMISFGWHRNDVVMDDISNRNKVFIVHFVEKSLTSFHDQQFLCRRKKSFTFLICSYHDPWYHGSNTYSFRKSKFYAWALNIFAGKEETSRTRAAILANAMVS
jgi:hypothetical protein